MIAKLVISTSHGGRTPLLGDQEPRFRSSRCPAHLSMNGH